MNLFSIGIHFTPELRQRSQLLHSSLFTRNVVLQYFCMVFGRRNFADLITSTRRCYHQCPSPGSSFAPIRRMMCMVLLVVAIDLKWPSGKTPVRGWGPWLPFLFVSRLFQCFNDSVIQCFSELKKIGGHYHPHRRMVNVTLISGKRFHHRWISKTNKKKNKRKEAKKRKNANKKQYKNQLIVPEFTIKHKYRPRNNFSISIHHQKLYQNSFLVVIRH